MGWGEWTRGTTVRHERLHELVEGVDEKGEEAGVEELGEGITGLPSGTVQSR